MPTTSPPPDRPAAPTPPQAAAQAPSQPTPSQPAPSQPAPSQPAPSQPAPSQPAPSQAAPSQAAPSQPAPSQAGAAIAPAGPPGSFRPAPGAPAVAPLYGPWADSSIFGRRWPGPGRPASLAAMVAVLLAAVVAALSVPLDRPGVGWSVAAIGGVVALIVARVVPDRLAPTAPRPLVKWRPRALGPARFAWSAATVALLAVGTVRAAGWLFVLCLATALLTGALAVTGGRSARGMALAAVLAPFAAPRALIWLVRGATTAHRGGGRGARIAATVAVSVALLLVFGSLFASADAAFADIITAVVPDIDAGTVTRWIFVFGVTTGIVGGAAFLRAAPPDLSGLDGPGRRRVGRLEWAVPLTLLVLLFGLFVGVQITVLFGGSQHVLGTEGLTYAEYARGGFWQLLIVTGLTLLVLAGAARWAPRETRTDRVLIRVVLGALAALTLVIVASALHRMDLYADTYGLTRLRVLVAVCEMWLGAVFVLVLGAGLRLRAAWLPRAVVAAGVLALLGLAAADPDHLIADRNVTLFERTGRIDTAYLSQLSADAVPALNRLSGYHRDCALEPVHEHLDTHRDDWRGANLARARARDVLRSDPPAAHTGCPGQYPTTR